MQRPFTPPDELRQFIRALPAPAPVPPAIPTPDDATTWPEAARSHAAGTQATPQPLPAWLAARDAYISHIMACRLCVTNGPKEPRHCATGDALRQQYDAATATETKRRYE